LIYGPTHVTAARRSVKGFQQYDPENGSVNYYSVDDFTEVFGKLTLRIGG